MSLVALTVHNYVSSLKLDLMCEQDAEPELGSHKQVDKSGFKDINTTKHYIIRKLSVYQFTSLQTQKTSNRDPVLLMSIPVHLCFHACLPHTTAAIQLICKLYKDIGNSNTQDDSQGKLGTWEWIQLVIIRKKVHMNMCPILNGYRDTAV